MLQRTVTEGQEDPVCSSEHRPESRSPMKNLTQLSQLDRDRLLTQEPQAYDLSTPAHELGYALGAIVYTPGTRVTLRADLGKLAEQGASAVIIDLEDAVPEELVSAAESNVVTQLLQLPGPGPSVPLIFIRVRHAEQLPELARRLGATALNRLAGFVFPKFNRNSAPRYLSAFAEANEIADGHGLLFMPIIETADLLHLESRNPELQHLHRIIQDNSSRVPMVHIGTTDLSAIYGLRRNVGATVYDLGVVAQCIYDTVNVFSRSAVHDVPGAGVSGIHVASHEAQSQVLLCEEQTPDGSGLAFQFGDPDPLFQCRWSEVLGHVEGGQVAALLHVHVRQEVRHDRVVCDVAVTLVECRVRLGGLPVGVERALDACHPAAEPFTDLLGSESFGGSAQGIAHGRRLEQSYGLAVQQGFLSHYVLLWW